MQWWLQVLCFQRERERWRRTMANSPSDRSFERSHIAQFCLFRLFSSVSIPMLNQTSQTTPKMPKQTRAQVQTYRFYYCSTSNLNVAMNCVSLNVSDIQCVGMFRIFIVHICEWATTESYSLFCCCHCTTRTNKKRLKSSKIHTHSQAKEYSTRGRLCGGVVFLYTSA